MEAHELCHVYRTTQSHLHVVQVQTLLSQASLHPILYRMRMKHGAADILHWTRCEKSHLHSRVTQIWRQNLKSGVSV